jgi:hypothetical protein
VDFLSLCLAEKGAAWMESVVESVSESKVEEMNGDKMCGCFCGGWEIATVMGDEAGHCC